MADDATTPTVETPPEPAEPVKRAKALYYIGDTDPVSGAPAQYVLGVPARDLTEDDIRVLSEAEYAGALGAGIYAKTAPALKKGGGS